MAEDWKLPWAGGCRCGRLRFEISAPPMLSMACHCLGCQSMTGGPYSLSFAIPAAGFRITQGEPVAGGLHGVNQHMHCGYCMSWVFTKPGGMDWFVNVRPTALDDHRWFTPYAEIETAEGFPWAKTGAPHSFPGMPPPETFQALVQSYAKEAFRDD